jgi:heat shock protein HslJ
MKNLLLILLVVMTSCGDKQEKKEDPMQPQRAVSEEMDLSGSYVFAQLRDEEITSEEISLKIDEERKEVMGNAGCNRFSVQYERDGNNISFRSRQAQKCSVKEKWKGKRI